MRITDIDAHKDDVSSAIELYGRLPEEERYDDDVFINLIRCHLSGDFGPHRPAAYWKAYFLIAKSGENVVGMLLGYNYNDTQSNFLYIPYLVAIKPQPNERKISHALVNALVDLQQDVEQIRFLAEVDDPAETEDPIERDNRRARIRLFGMFAGFAGIELRAIAYKFVQPKLEIFGNMLETKLLMLYGTKALPSITLRRTELLQIITWFYKQLYAANIPVHPDEEKKYRDYLDQLLTKATRTLPPTGVRLLRLREIYQVRPRCRSSAGA